MLKPKKISAETALRATDIIANSFRVDKQNSRWVAPARVELTRNGYCIYTITKSPGERARTHKVLVHPEPGYRGNFSRCPSIKILCDCQRHKFVWNYALQEYDAAIKDVTNGEPPVVTNPDLIPGGCKHSLVALRYLQKLDPFWTSPLKKRETPWSGRRGEGAAGLPDRVRLTDLRSARREARGERNFR